MNPIKVFFRTTSWTVLSLMMSVLLVAVSTALIYLVQQLDKDVFLTLLLLGIGFSGVFGGYIISRHAGYELLPKSRQIAGAAVNGVAISVMLYAAFSMFTLAPFLAAETILPAAFTLLFVEFMVLRISQNRKVNLFQFLAILLVGTVMLLLNKMIPEDMQRYFIMFLLAGITMECVGRYSTTYLLSPWVNSFWNGLTMLVSAILFIIFLSPMSAKAVMIEVATIPLWLALAIAVIGLLTLCFRFIKHKIRVSAGYLQYKLQFLALLLLVFSALLTKFHFETIFAYVLLIVAIALAEGKIFIKE